MQNGEERFTGPTMESRFPGALTPRGECPSWAVPQTPLALRGMESDIQAPFAGANAQYYAQFELYKTGPGLPRTRATDLDMTDSVSFGFGGDHLHLGPHREVGDFALRVLHALACSRGTPLGCSNHFGASSLGFIDQLLLVYVDENHPPADLSALAPGTMYFWAHVLLGASLRRQ